MPQKLDRFSSHSRSKAISSSTTCLMNPPRISASSYSNTAPLIWSFLYGSNHGKVELILDNAPARSAELLSQGRVGTALVPVIAYQQIGDVKLVPDVCVGARERVRSVCLVTKGESLENVRSVSLDVSSRTSTALTKIIFREFMTREPIWRDAEPDLDAMLSGSDAALLIGDPALSIVDLGVRNAESKTVEEAESALRVPHSAFRVFDLAGLWHKHTGLGFVFAMWMALGERPPIDFAAARDEGVAHIEEIVANYHDRIPIGRGELRSYLSENISYSIDDSMQAGMELYFRFTEKHGLTERNRPLEYLRPH